MRESAEVALSWVLANDPDSGAELAAAWADVDDGPEVLASVVVEGMGQASAGPLDRSRHAQCRWISSPAQLDTHIESGSFCKSRSARISVCTPRSLRAPLCRFAPK